MASQPELYSQIQREADALFKDGDPDNDAYTPEAIDITRRFIMETLRLYAIVPMSLRTVMNTCSVEGYELEEGTPVHIAQAATHYMEDFFPDPHKFDIDRYLPPRNEHHQPRVRTLRSRHAHLPRFPMDGTPTRRQLADDRTLLHP